MINKRILECMQKQFEADPNLLQNDQKLAEVFHITKILFDIDISIETLYSLVKNNGNPYYKKLKDAWSSFLINANLPHCLVAQSCLAQECQTPNYLATQRR